MPHRERPTDIQCAAAICVSRSLTNKYYAQVPLPCGQEQTQRIWTVCGKRRRCKEGEVKKWSGARGGFALYDFVFV